MNFLKQQIRRIVTFSPALIMTLCLCLGATAYGVVVYADETVDVALDADTLSNNPEQISVYYVTFQNQDYQTGGWFTDTGSMTDSVYYTYLLSNGTSTDSIEVLEVKYDIEATYLEVVPEITAFDTDVFTGWQDAEGNPISEETKVTANAVYYAGYESGVTVLDDTILGSILNKQVAVTYQLDGTYGSFGEVPEDISYERNDADGIQNLLVYYAADITPTFVPEVYPIDGYVFTGWADEFGELWDGFTSDSQLEQMNGAKFAAVFEAEEGPNENEDPDDGPDDQVENPDETEPVESDTPDDSEVGNPDDDVIIGPDTMENTPTPTVPDESEPVEPTATPTPVILTPTTESTTEPTQTPTQQPSGNGSQTAQNGSEPPILVSANIFSTPTPIPLESAVTQPERVINVDDGVANTSELKTYVLKIVDTTGNNMKVSVKENKTLDQLVTALGYTGISSWGIKQAEVSTYQISGTTTMATLSELFLNGDVCVIAYGSDGVPMGCAVAKITSEKDVYDVLLSKDTNVALRTATEAAEQSRTDMSGKGAGQTETKDAVTQDGKSDEVAEAIHTGDSVGWIICIVVIAVILLAAAGYGGYRLYKKYQK